MLPIVSLLVIVFLSLVVTRIATVALVHTGLGREAARFQARSALTGVGFTTSEAEQIVSHPVRRRVVMVLMLVGNAGIVTAMASLLLSFVSPGGADGMTVLGLLAGGVALIWWIASSEWVDARLSRLISWALVRWTSIDARDYAKLLHLHHDYGVTELLVRPGDWLANRELRETRLVGEGILVLGIECPGGEFIGAPNGTTEVRPGDRLVLYGRIGRIAEVDLRVTGNEGDRAHDRAVSEQVDISGRERSEAGR